NVVEMGLLRECRVSEDGVTHILLSATSPSCVLISSIMQGVVEEVGKVTGPDKLDVQLDLHTFWTTDMMTEEGRQKLDARRQGSLQRVPLRPQQWREGPGESTPEPDASPSTAPAARAASAMAH